MANDKKDDRVIHETTSFTELCTWFQKVLREADIKGGAGAGGEYIPVNNVARDMASDLMDSINKEEIRLYPTNAGAIVIKDDETIGVVLPKAEEGEVVGDHIVLTSALAVRLTDDDFIDELFDEMEEGVARSGGCPSHAKKKVTVH